jgi:hypothetical protein
MLPGVPMPRTLRRLSFMARPLLVALLVSSRARATDPFEVQVYDGTANAPGVPGLELHVNRVMEGLKTFDGPQLPANHQTHFTLEPSLGLLPFWEIGGYFETALLPDGTFAYAGVKLRSKFVTPPDFYPHLRLGLNVEVSLLPQTFDRDRWGSELRPIVAWEDERWVFVINPIVDTSLEGNGLHDGPSFQPAAMALRKIAGKVSVGIEYYANLGPFSGFVPWRKEEQYVYEVVNLLSVKRLELNVGVGEGLSAASNDLVFKTIVGFAFEDLAGEKQTVSAPTRFDGHGP